MSHGVQASVGYLLLECVMVHKSEFNQCDTCGRNQTSMSARTFEISAMFLSSFESRKSPKNIDPFLFMGRLSRL